MKKSIIIITLIFLKCHFVFSQSASNHSLCDSLSLFNGDWLYTNSAMSETIRIYFRYHEFVFSGTLAPERRGVLIGWHKYVKNNNLVESTYENRFAALPDNFDDIPVNSYSIIISATGCDLSKQKLMGTIKDLSQANELKIVRLNFNPSITEINWKQSHGEGYGTFSGAFGMTLPREFTLVKQ